MVITLPKVFPKGLQLCLTAWLAIPLLLLAQDNVRQVGWHHNGSPYRAVFEIETPPNPAEAGVVLAVPVFNLGYSDGIDVYCYDDRGRQLLRSDLGQGAPNEALVHVRPTDVKRRIYAYFGSKRRAPVAKMDVRPMLGEVYALPEGSAANWKDVNARLQEAQLIGRFPIDRLEQVVNPINATETFIMVMTGVMSVPRNVTRHFFVASDDAGYLLVDGEVRIERNGRNHVYSSLRGENRKAIELTPGRHEIKLVGVNFGGAFALALGEWFATPKVALVPPSDFIQAGRGKLLEVEARHRDAANPLFHYRHLSYMSFDECQYTETELATWGGQEAEWRFGDGVVMRGAVVRRVFATLKDCPVQTVINRRECSGVVCFPQATPPVQRQAGKANDYQYYEKLLLDAGFNRMRDLESLRPLLTFFLRRDCHPAQVDVAEAILKCRPLDEDTRLAALTALARAAAKDQPGKTLTAYDNLFKQKLSREQFADYLQEALAFVIFRMRDCPLAEKMLNRHASRLPKGSDKLLAGLRFDIALQGGDLQEARRWYGVMLEGRQKATERRTATVLGNSLQEKAALAIASGQQLEAEAALREWAAVSPHDRGNGSFSLQRARLFRKRGWLDGALGELTGAILADPLLPNLPDVEFERAEIFTEMGEHAKAKEIYQKIVTDYPNHPLATTAAQKIR